MHQEHADRADLAGRGDDDLVGLRRDPVRGARAQRVRDRDDRLDAAGAADLRGRLGHEVDQPAGRVDVDDDRADVVVGERLAERLAERLQPAAEAEQHAQERAARRDGAAQRDRGDLAALVDADALAGGAVAARGLGRRARRSSPPACMTRRGDLDERLGHDRPRLAEHQLGAALARLGFDAVARVAVAGLDHRRLIGRRGDRRVLIHHVLLVGRRRFGGRASRCLRQRRRRELGAGRLQLDRIQTRMARASTGRPSVIAAIAVSGLNPASIRLLSAAACPCWISTRSLRSSCRNAISRASYHSSESAGTSISVRERLADVAPRRAQLRVRPRAARLPVVAVRGRVEPLADRRR